MSQDRALPILRPRPRLRGVFHTHAFYLAVPLGAALAVEVSLPADAERDSGFQNRFRARLLRCAAGSRGYICGACVGRYSSLVG